MTATQGFLFRTGRVEYDSDLGKLQPHLLVHVAEFYIPRTPISVLVSRNIVAGRRVENELLRFMMPSFLAP